MLITPEDTGSYTGFQNFDVGLHVDFSLYAIIWQLAFLPSHRSCDETFV